MALTVVDAGVLIAFLEPDDAHHDAATDALTQAATALDDLVVPIAALAEFLVGPSRRGRRAVDQAESTLDAIGARVEPATRAIGRRAAALRAQHGPAMRLPDALVVATATELGAGRILTTDRRLPRYAVMRRTVGRKTAPPARVTWSATFFSQRAEVRNTDQSRT